MNMSDPHTAMHAAKDEALRVVKESGMNAVPALMVLCTWMLCMALHSCTEAMCETFKRDQS